MERRRVLEGIGFVMGLGGVLACALGAEGRRRQAAAADAEPGAQTAAGRGEGKKSDRGAASAMAAAGRAFLAALTPEQRKGALFPFDSEERFNWHFIPRERHGLPFKAMDAAQREKAHAFLKTGLSHAG